MSPETSDHVPMTVWCTLIPPNEIGRLVEFEEELRMVNETYEDWLVSMRSKSLVGSNIGMLLDRIRILMINIGIACAVNRDLAEEIQSILSTTLRNRALDIVSELPDDPPEKMIVKDILSTFFEELKFTRDIFPEEEIERVALENVKPFGGSKVKRGMFGKILGSTKGLSKTIDIHSTTKDALFESTNILKRIYMRLLSPDPWGEY